MLSGRVMGLCRAGARSLRTLDATGSNEHMLKGSSFFAKRCLAAEVDSIMKEMETVEYHNVGDGDGGVSEKEVYDARTCPFIEYVMDDTMRTHAFEEVPMSCYSKPGTLPEGYKAPEGLFRLRTIEGVSTVDGNVDFQESVSKVSSKTSADPWHVQGSHH